MTRKFVILNCMAFVLCASAQQKLAKTFYDFKKTKVKEEFFTNDYGVKNGAYKEYSAFGGIIAQGTYKNDTKVGAWTYNDEKGVSADIETFDMEGIKNGKWLTHCLFNRKLKSAEGVYKDGKKNGLWIEYECASDPRTTGLVIKSKETYSMGVIDGMCQYNLPDEEYETGTIKGGVRVGEWKQYDKNGILLATVLHTGKSFGPFALRRVVVYYKDGKIQVKRNVLSNYQNIMQSKLGEEIFYDSTGVIEIKNVWNKDSITDHYKDAYYTGTHEEYYPSGKLSVTCDVRFESGSTYFIGHKIGYFETGKKEWESKHDRNGTLIPGSYVEYLPNGEPNEKTRK